MAKVLNTDNVNELSSEIVVGATGKGSSYSTHFTSNFNLDGSPSSVTLENIFKRPQDNIDSIVGYAKYCYRKYGIIMRVINIIRDFGATNVKLEYPSNNKKAKKIIDDYNKRINIKQLLRDFIYELSLTGNLACYDRDGKRIDIYPINLIDVVPLLKNGKQVIAYKIEQSMLSLNSYGKEIDDAIKVAYPDEIVKAMKEGKASAILNEQNSYFAKINASQYEPYGLSVILPAFEDLAHKSLLKEAEKATVNDIIEKIMLVKIGDKDNKPNRALIDAYTNLLDGIKGSVRLTVPYYVSAEFIEPETSIFQQEKFSEVDTDILNTLGISLSLIRGESGGNYSEGIINFSGLTRTIENIRQPLVDIIEGLYAKELERNGVKAELCPKVSFEEVIIDKSAKLELVKELFTTAGLPYQVMYEEFGYNFDAIKVIREEENKENIDETFKLHSMPFQGEQGLNQGGDNEGGAPKKNMSERKTDTPTERKQERTGLEGTNRTANK